MFTHPHLFSAHLRPPTIRSSAHTSTVNTSIRLVPIHDREKKQNIFIHTERQAEDLLNP